MAIKAISTTTSSFSSTGWPKEQVTEDAVNQLFVQKFTEIVSSYEERKKAASVKDLATGPWYATDYALALERRKEKPRLDHLIKKHSFYNGYPPKGFALVSNPESPTKIAVHSYQLQKSVLPAQALDNVNHNQFSFIDCGMALDLARYGTVRELGEKLFNDRFSADGACPLRLYPLTRSSPLLTLGLIKQVNFETDAISPQFGDHVSFGNVPLYTLKHLNGAAGAFNAVCISRSSERDKKYIAYGLPVEGKTESGIEDVLIDEFNKKPIDPSLVLSKDMVNHFIEEYKGYEAEFTVMTGQQVASYTINREDFDTVVEQSNHKVDKVGLRPYIWRFDLEGIHEYLSDNHGD